EERDLIGRAGQRNPTSGASLRPNEPGFGELLALLGQEMKLDVQVVAQLANGNVAVRLERNEIQGGAKTVLTTTREKQRLGDGGVRSRKLRLETAAPKNVSTAERRRKPMAVKAFQDKLEGE